MLKEKENKLCELIYYSQYILGTTQAATNANWTQVNVIAKLERVLGQINNDENIFENKNDMITTKFGITLRCLNENEVLSNDSDT